MSFEPILNCKYPYWRFRLTGKTKFLRDGFFGMLFSDQPSEPYNPDETLETLRRDNQNTKQRIIEKRTGIKWERKVMIKYRKRVIE